MIPVNSLLGRILEILLVICLQMLEANGGITAGSRIVLITDGAETVKPWVRDVKPAILRKGITVDSVLISARAASVMISLAAQTGELLKYRS